MTPPSDPSPREDRGAGQRPAIEPTVLHQATAAQPWPRCLIRAYTTALAAGAALIPHLSHTARLRFADHEHLAVAGAVPVIPAPPALPPPAPRHRGDEGFSAPVEGGGAGHLDGGAPGAAGLADHERLLVAGAGCVGTAPAAVGRRGAGHRVDFSEPAPVEGGGAGHLDGGAPGAAG